MFSLACTSESPETLAYLRRLVASRWLVLVALALAAALTPQLLDVALPQAALFSVLGVAACFNVVAVFRLRQASRASSCELLSQLLFDLASLAALVFLSGGAANPLVSLLLPTVAIAALTLPRALVLAVTAAAIGAYSLLMFFYLPLPVSDASRATRLHLGGMWLIFVISAVMIGGLIVRMTQRVRQRDAALAAAREQALRDERVMAMGTLAAGAAHELGTPLATINLLAGELASDQRLPAEVLEDLALLRQQVGICKQIISNLSRKAGVERLENAARQPVDRWLEKLREHWHARNPRCSSQLQLLGQGETPAIVADPRLEQALLNLLNNAARHGPEAVRISLDWNTEALSIAIRDSGPGFPPSVLADGGQRSFAAHATGSGIGLVLTRSAVEQLGGRLQLSNPAEGGALARIELPRKQA